MKKATKEPDYKGFVKHLKTLDRQGVPWGKEQLAELAKRYRTPLPAAIGKKKAV